MAVSHHGLRPTLQVRKDNGLPANARHMTVRPIYMVKDRLYRMRCQRGSIMHLGDLVHRGLLQVLPMVGLRPRLAEIFRHGLHHPGLVLPPRSKLVRGLDSARVPTRQRRFQLVARRRGALTLPFQLSLVLGALTRRLQLKLGCEDLSRRLQLRLGPTL